MNSSPPHDGSYKSLFSHPEMVESLIRDFVPEDWVHEVDFTTLEKQNGSYVTDDLRERHDDVIWRVQCHGQWFYVYLLIEFQSTVDPGENPGTVYKKRQYIFFYDSHQTSAEYVLNNRSLRGDPYNCFQVMQDDERRRVGKRQFACPPVGIVVVSLTGGNDKAVLIAHDGNLAGKFRGHDTDKRHARTNNHRFSIHACTDKSLEGHKAKHLRKHPPALSVVGGRVALQ